jgi:hypothetical protein
MKRLIIALVFLLIPISLFGALGAGTVWEVRPGTSGTGTAGGGFTYATASQVWLQGAVAIKAK